MFKNVFDIIFKLQIDENTTCNNSKDNCYLYCLMIVHLIKLHKPIRGFTLEQAYIITKRIIMHIHITASSYNTEVV